MEPTYRLTLAPIRHGGSPFSLQGVMIQAQLTPLRSPSRKTIENTAEFASMLTRLAPEGSAGIMERLEHGETVTLDEAIPRRTLISLEFEYV